MTQCLLNRKLTANCAPPDESSTVPLYEIIGPVLCGFLFILFGVLMLWRRYYRKTESLNERLLETKQEGEQLWL